jgi:hypothetical protein
MRRPHLILRRPIAGQQVPGPRHRSPAALLGPNHPLTRGYELRRDLWRQSLVTAAAVMLAAIGTASGHVWGPPLLVSAAIVQLGLAVGLALQAGLQRERARELIIAGRSGLSLPAVERELRRLQRPRRRAGLADALEELVRAAERWPRLIPTCRPVFDPGLVRAAAPQLRAIAAGLRTGTATACAVARVERLLTSGASPLYGREPDALGHELMRIHTELEGADGARTVPRGPAHKSEPVR